MAATSAVFRIAAVVMIAFLALGSFTWTAALLSLLTSVFLLSVYLGQESLLYQPNAIPPYKRPRDNPPGLRSPAEYGVPVLHRLLPPSLIKFRVKLCLDLHFQFPFLVFPSR
jgi:hypothetical protein